MPKTKIAVKKHKDILRIRLPRDSYKKIEELADGVHMDIPDLTKFIMSSVSRVRPDRFHAAIAEMVKIGGK